ncbi:Uncharacterised protein [Shigella sonnei]|nr:Uncharacterised protein [Shigella sonnei]
MSISTIDKKRLFFVAFFFPLKPAIGKTDCPTMLPERFKHATGCGSFYAGVNQRRFIPPSGSISPENRIQMKVFITFTEQKNFGSRRDVVSANGFGIVGNIAFNIFREKRKVIFTRLGLGKASTHRNLLRSY